MTQRRDGQAQDRATRGSVALRVLLIIVGVILILFGMVVTFATIAVALEDDMGILFFLPGSIASVFGGIFIIIKQTEMSKADKEAAAAEADSERIVSAVPIASGPQQAAAPSSTEIPTPVNSEAEDVARLVFRSTDLIATLRDLARHALSERSDKYHLATMLEAAGIMGWQDAPACEGGRLSRNTHFWIRMPVDDLSAENYDTLISAEAALNVNQDLPRTAKRPLTDPAVEDACLKLMREMVAQRIDRGPLTGEGLRACYHDEHATGTGDWLVRSIVCNAAECVRTPFRVVYDLRVNIKGGLVVLGLEAPRPACFAIFTDDKGEQATYARAYALRLSTLLAAHAFEASDRVTRVVVNCHEHDSEETILSLDISPKMLQTLLKVTKKPILDEGFPTDEHIRAKIDGEAWLEPVESFVTLGSPEALPEGAELYPELDTRTTSEAIVRNCGAKRVCDLGINEKAIRIASWRKISEELGDKVETAVSALVAARDASTDITVAEACNRTMQALINGEVELENLVDLGQLFVDGSSLDRAVSRAIDLLDDENGHEDPEAALSLLESALSPIDDMGAYLDDDACVYRYFGSVQERINHNLVIDEGGREVRLVPDSYFNAHINASIALGMLGRNDEALAHAETCMRLAPTSTYAAMRKVRVLEAESRIYEAADLIIKTLHHAITPRDASVCHYRLAYMEWKLGREDLAAACYVRSLTWHNTPVASEAREELDDLVKSIPSLERPTEEQADALLAREGIPLGCVRSDGERLLGAAVACMEDIALYPARSLMASVFEMNGDDVVMGVYRSLNVEV